MNEYKIDWSRDDYGYIIIKADSEQDARDLFDTGEYTEDELVVKGGSCLAIEKVEKL